MVLAATQTMPDLLSVLSSASPIVLISLFVAVLLKGGLVLPREVERRDKELAEAKLERDEYKNMAFKLANIGERVTTAVEGRSPYE